MNRLLLSGLAVVLALVLLFAAISKASHDGYRSGYADGQLAASEKCQHAQLESITAVIDSARGLTAAANEASQQLGRTISARQQADAKATKEIRHALALSVSQRADCVFDADVMQQLEAARDRAAQAAAGGIRGPVPTPR